MSSNRRLAPEARLAAYERLLETLRTIPGVVAVGGADSTIASGYAPMNPLTSDGSIRGGRFQASTGYFDTLETPFIAGRAFTETEVAARAPVAILDISGVQVFFPGVPASHVVGRRLVIRDDPPRTIVGVIPNLKDRRGEVTTPSLYLPLGAEPSHYMPVVIRMAPGTTPPLRVIQQRLGADLGRSAIPEASSIAAAVDTGLRDPRFRAVVFSVLAIAALLLAAVGLYSVASFEVAMRRHEMGVRLTLGARGRDIQRMVLADACKPIALGVVLGLAGAYWTERYLRNFMYGLEPRDPGNYATVIAIVLGTALIAAWLPARRAARQDPAEVLRAH